MKPIKVLIIDDSALTRSVLQQILNSDPKIEVVGTAMDPIIAAKKIQLRQPDVITLDLEMPRMDGLTFLKKLKANSPKPVIVISGTSVAASRKAIEALDYRAIEIIEKPDISTPEKLQDVAEMICDSIKAVAHACPFAEAQTIRPMAGYIRRVVAPVDMPNELSSHICVIGASTGGPDIIREIFEALPSGPGFVVAQHMPALFTRSFADRINSFSHLKIKEAEPGDYIRDNQVLIIPGDYHGVIRKDERGYFVHLSREPKVNRHRPSVDVLFESAAEVGGGRVTGVLLTGMGDDGARGLLKIKNLGGRTIAQHSSSCVVYGMPRKAIEIDAAREVLTTPEIICQLNELKY